MYFFEARARESNGSSRELLVIFSGQLEPSEGDYAGLFEREFRNFLKPDGILFIFPAYISQQVLAHVDNKRAFFQNITRFGQNVPVGIYSFNESGELRRERIIFEDTFFAKFIPVPSVVVEAGLTELSRRHLNEVLVESPPGTVFSKPSGQSSQEFIKASGLARDYSEQQFVAYALLVYRPTHIDIKEIYIDTASIAVFAEIVTYYLHRFAGTDCKSVRYSSFSSYVGMEKCKPDDPESVWVIISASASNSMCLRIVRDWGLSSDQVVTILTFSDRGRRLANIRPLSRYVHAKEKADSAVKVQVVGENFTAEISAPRRVLIKESHKPREVDRCIRPFATGEVFKCNKSVRSSAAKSIYVDFNEELARNADFDAWLERVIRWYLPREIGYVIADGSQGGELLYSLFQEKLAQLGVNESFPRVDIRDAGHSVTGDKAVVVLLPAISTGRSLLNLNRELRLSGHQGNRIFICPFVLSPSAEDIGKLKRSLLHGPDGFKYLFLSCFELSVGRPENSWDLERGVVEQLSDCCFWQRRLKQLEQQGSGLEGHLGCPTPAGDGRLAFSPGFVFWSKWGIEPNLAAPEALYATIAAVLQHLREEGFAERQDSLRSHVYQHAVIDPDNFTRFNDPILQSCIWRAAYSTELDYRRSDELSDAMVTIILRLVQDLGSNKADAALDMLMAVATKKVALSKKCLQDLVERTKPHLDGDEAAEVLLRYIEENLL